jgi:outer membrane PBP1 activator LpoA protein
VQPDHPAVMAYSKPAEEMPIDYERLYALGIDAWRLVQLVIRADRPQNIPLLDGVTGRITLEGHQFVRVLASGEMRDGRPALFKPVE